MPLIRYRIGDLAMLREDGRPCRAAGRPAHLGGDGRALDAFVRPDGVWVHG
jgi:phenylacetate-coenzyme A ligase PaaK-like adenylate-forming protein